MADETKVELVRNSVETKMRMIKTLVLEGENEEVNKVEKKLIGDIKNLIKNAQWNKPEMVQFLQVVVNE